MLQVAGNASKFWPPFEEKIVSFNSILGVRDVFEKYSEHILRKFIANGYDRLQFRSLLVGLKDYDSEGNFVADLGDNSFSETFDKVYQKVRL